MVRKAHATSLIDKVRGTINEYQLVAAGDIVVCGISGGPDSVCLARVLAALRAEYQLDILLAHLNYRKRGEESDLDETLCRDLATELGMPIHVKQASSSDLDMMDTHNFQSQARKFRYRFFESLCENCHAQRIAVGHTADDVVESSLMHLFRGSGIKGLAGIYPKSGKTVRPLIGCSREEIVEYLDANQVAYRTDSSNLGREFSRNRIRNELLPYIRENFSAQIDSAIFRTAQIARLAQRFLDRHANDLWAEAVSRSRLGKIIINLHLYRSADDIIRFELLRRAQMELLCSIEDRRSVDFWLILEADRLVQGKVGARADIGAGVMVERGHDELIVFSEIDSAKETLLILPGENAIRDFNLRIQGELLEQPLPIPKMADEWEAFIDAGRLPNGEWIVRGLEDGDSVRLLNAPGTKKVAELLIDRKIPRALRAEIPVVLYNDSIIWIVGVGIADRVKITEQTEKVLKLHAEDCVIR